MVNVLLSGLTTTMLKWFSSYKSLWITVKWSESHWAVIAYIGHLCLWLKKPQHWGWHCSNTKIQSGFKTETEQACLKTFSMFRYYIINDFSSAKRTKAFRLSLTSTPNPKSRKRLCKPSRSTLVPPLFGRSHWNSWLLMMRRRPLGNVSILYSCNRPIQHNYSYHLVINCACYMYMSKGR